MQATEKQLKYTVAIILRNKQKPDEFLIVKRPAADRDLGGHWGLPATTLLAGELPEDAAQRICREKLSCRAVPTRFVGVMTQLRNSYDLCLMDIEMLVVDGQPDVSQATATGTLYTAQRWTTDLGTLLPSAQHGSCCSAIFLTDQGLLQRSQWIGSLQGSATVG